MIRNHLWRGEWIGDSELEARVDRLESELNATLLRRPLACVLLDACESLRSGLRNDAELRSYLFPDPVDAGTVEELIAFLERDQLNRKLLRELGTRQPEEIRLVQENVFEGWAPLGFLVHVAPSNVPTVGALSVIEGLLSGNGVISSLSVSLRSSSDAM